MPPVQPMLAKAVKGVPDPAKFDPDGTYDGLGLSFEPLMDATSVMLGQEFAGYAATVRYGAERLDAVLPRVQGLPLGGTPSKFTSWRQSVTASFIAGSAPSGLISN